MKPLIDFDECLRDSPKFRWVNENLLLVESEISYVLYLLIIKYIIFYLREQLETEEASIEALEQKLDKVLKTCSVMIESGKMYMTQRRWNFLYY